MVCRNFEWLTPSGHVARGIACGQKPRRKRCRCGALTDRICDWRIAERRPDGTYLTCDKPVCDRCATHPKAGKDICPDHRDHLGEFFGA